MRALDDAAPTPRTSATGPAGPAGLIGRQRLGTELARIVAETGVAEAVHRAAEQGLVEFHPPPWADPARS
jgi:hypothetical protein